jgi:hypothetical protein
LGGRWPNFFGGSKILRGEENPAFHGKLALGKRNLQVNVLYYRLY